MAYSNYKDTSNRFVPEVTKTWNSLVSFDGNNFIEKIVGSVSQIIVLLALVILIPIGMIESIHNSFYNLQKNAFDRLNSKSDSTSEFASSIEFAIYFILDLPFFIILIPFWILSIVFVWMAKNKIFTIILIALICIYFFFLKEYVEEIFQNFSLV